MPQHRVPVALPPGDRGLDPEAFSPGEEGFLLPERPLPRVGSRRCRVFIDPGITYYRLAA